MKFLRTSCFAAMALAAMNASADIPVKILNNSNGDFADSDVYIAIVGQTKSGHIYYNLTESAAQKRCVISTLDESVNRLHAQDGDWGYADIFTKLSDITDQTFYIGDTFACRMFISFKSPMYLHAFGNGYAGADMNNPGDPNAKVRWELIEFTYEPEMYNGQIWINHTRVDAFQYPMGLELYASGNRDGSRPYTKRGEIVNYKTVIDRWNQAYSGTVYKDCYYNLIDKDNLGGIIKQPSKVETVKHAQIFDAYINKIWDYFRTNEANINMGMLGRWTGRVQGDAFVLTCAEGTYWAPGSVATVNKPTTEDAIEGAGPFAQGTDIDKTVQSMFCAAFNRGQFRAQTAEQNWDPETGIKPFQGGTEYPCNEYVKFFHDTTISASDGKTYAFAYDDTFDQSATCYTTEPTAITVTIGGFADGGGGGEVNPNPNPNPTPDPDPEPEPDPQPTGVPSAPAPTKSADLVKSFFSDAYASVAPGLVYGSWGQSTMIETVSLDGNNAYKFTSFDYLGLQVSSDNAVVNVSDMAYLHVDLYSPVEMDLYIHPISLNPTVDGDMVAKHLNASVWNSFDIALSEFPNVKFDSFGQFKFDGGNGQTFYLDNLYMWREEGTTPVDPDPIVPDPKPADGVTAAPAPAHEDHQVKSFFSGAYTSIAPDMFVGSWGQSTQTQIVACDGDDAYRLTNFNYLGFQIPGDATVDISNMKYIHIDLYSTHEMDINIHPISLQPTVIDGDKATKHLNAGEWNSFDMPLTDFPNVNFAAIGQFKFENMTPAQAPAIKRAADSNERAVYLDNLYAWNPNLTGIDTVEAASATDGKVYDLFGRVVREDSNLQGLAKGIYIVGGRKVAVTR